MRIGILTGEYPPLQGGVGGYCDILAKTITELGHHVFIFSNDRAEAQAPQIPLTSYANGWGPGSIRAVNQWVQARALDIVNLQFQTAAYDMSPWIHFMPHFINTAFVTTFHDLRFPYLFPKAGPLRDWIVMHLARASAGVITTNYEDHSRVEQRHPSQMIPMGATVQTAMPTEYSREVWRQQAGATDRDFLLGYFGFINHSKGVDTLIEAIAILNTDDLPVKLVFVGGRTGTADPTNASYAAMIDDLIEQRGINAQIFQTGFVTEEEIGAYLKAVDVVVLPFRDGASYRRSSLMVAIQHECAIITTQPQIETPAFTSDNLLMVQADSADALAEAIQSLYTAPALRQKLHGGIKQLKQHFNWHHIAQAHINFYERVLQAQTQSQR